MTTVARSLNGAPVARPLNGATVARPLNGTHIARALNGAPIALPGLAAEALQRAIHAVRHTVRRRRTQHALNRLSDHVLQDIGLRRGEIDSIARALAEGHPDPTRIARGHNNLCL